MSQDWGAVRGVNYAFPPVALVQKTAALVVQTGVVAVMVAPHWPSQVWWPVVFHEAAAMMVRLGSAKDGLFTSAPHLRPHPLCVMKRARETEWVAFWFPGRRR